jgi:hypothetical protein
MCQQPSLSPLFYLFCHVCSFYTDISSSLQISFQLLHFPLQRLHSIPLQSPSHSVDRNASSDKPWLATSAFGWLTRARRDWRGIKEEAERGKRESRNPYHTWDTFPWRLHRAVARGEGTGGNSRQLLPLAIRRHDGIICFMYVTHHGKLCQINQNPSTKDNCIFVL